MDAEFDSLIEEGGAFRADFLDGYRYRWCRYSEADPAYARWKRDALALVKAAFGPEHPHYTSLAAAERDLAAAAPGSLFSFFLNTLKKARCDLRLAAGGRGAAGLQEDLLLKAEGLARKGHFVSAATLAGAVLENMLRSLCSARGVFCPENASPEAINDRLMAAGVYDAGWHRETAARIALRRNAEQCYVEKITSARVEETAAWLREFGRRHFSAAAAASVPEL